MATMLVASTSLLAQIPNAGFETWTMPNGYNIPSDWDNLNTMTASTNTYTCMKGTPGSPGNSYIKLVTKNVAGMGVMPGIAVSGTLDMATMLPTAGFAYDQRPTALTGSWQHMGFGNDEGYIAVYVTKWNSSTNQRDTLGSVVHALGNMAMSWANFSIPITYTSTQTPDSCVIILSASGAAPEANSYLYVDNLGFTGVSVGTTTVNETASIKLYPNPAHSTLNIETSALNSPIEEALIVDVLGHTVMAINVNSTTNWSNINIGSLAAGNYFIKLRTQTGAYTQQFSKQ